MLKKSLSPSLFQTLEEVLPPKQALVIHSLIAARFHVLPKAGYTGDELPVLLLLPKTLDISASLKGRSARGYGAGTPGSRHSLNTSQRKYV